MTSAPKCNSIVIDKLIAADGVGIICSPLIADVTGTITGDIIGDITGNVTGNVDGGIVTGDSLSLPATVGDRQVIDVHNQYTVTLTVTNDSIGDKFIDVLVEEFGNIALLTFPEFTAVTALDGSPLTIDTTPLGTAIPEGDVCYLSYSTTGWPAAFSYVSSASTIYITQATAVPDTLPADVMMTFYGFTMPISKGVA